MHTAGILQQQDEAEESQLWKLTWDRINTFLPNLREEVFKPHDPGMSLCEVPVCRSVIPSKSLCDPGISLCDPGMSLCDPGMSLCDPGMSLCDPSIVAL